MTSLLVHENPDIFPEPHEFRPERWLEQASRGEDRTSSDSDRDRISNESKRETPTGQKSLQRYLIPFSRGTRGCVGINLAWAEMYLTLALLFRRFGFDVAGVVRSRDVDCVRDCIIAAPSKDARDMVVQVLPVAE